MMESIPCVETRHALFIQRNYLSEIALIQIYQVFAVNFVKNRLIAFQ